MNLGQRFGASVRTYSLRTRFLVTAAFAVPNLYLACGIGYWAKQADPRPAALFTFMFTLVCAGSVVILRQIWQSSTSWQRARWISTRHSARAHQRVQSRSRHPNFPTSEPKSPR